MLSVNEVCVFIKSEKHGFTGKTVILRVKCCVHVLYSTLQGCQNMISG